MPLEFRYFGASKSEVDFLSGSRICSLCGQPGRCFSFDNASATAGCVACLRLGTAYLGIWGPEDFAEAASEGEGRRLFLDMVQPLRHRSWPEDGEPRFGQNFVAFQCLHCQTRTGIWDID